MDKLQRNVILKPEEYSSRIEYQVEYSISHGRIFFRITIWGIGGWGWKVKDQTEEGLINTYTHDISLTVDKW